MVAPRRSWEAVVAWCIVGIAAIAAASLLLHVGRGTTWFYDEWSWILTRRTGSLDDYLANHNGHLNLIPVVVYKAMWSVFGLTDYTAFRVLAVVVHVGTCALLFVYLRRRAQIWFAVSATVVVLFLGYAFQDLLWPFQIQYLGAVAFGLLALLLLDRHDRIGDVGASVALAASVACSGVGLPFVGAVTIELLLRRKTWTKLWVPLAPLMLWGIWYLQYGQSQVKGSNLHLVPENAAQMGSAAVGAVVGIAMDDAHVLFALLALVVVVVVALERRISPRFAAVLALALGYWVLTALSRAQYDDPGASRYLYPGAVFVILVLGELVPRLRVPFGRVGAAIAVVVLLAVVAVSVHGNVEQLRDGAAGLRDASSYVKAELRAVELARDHVDPGFRPDPVRAPQIEAAGYLAAVDDLGSPAASLQELRRQSPEIRAAADAVLVHAIDARLGRAHSVANEGSPPTVTEVVGGTATPSGACVQLTPDTGADASGVVELRAGAPLVIEAASAPVSVSVRALADGFTPIGDVAPGTNRTMRLPRTGAGPWSMQLAAKGSLRVCDGN